jgi:hypothetical protein
MNKSELTELRLSLLQEIAERADEISRIDDRLNSITRDMIVMEQINHEMDGQDPDQPQRTRLTRESWQWCNNAADDMRELQAMSESDKRHYA